MKRKIKKNYRLEKGKIDAAVKTTKMFDILLQMSIEE